jgi:hypothetical protein
MKIGSTSRGAIEIESPEGMIVDILTPEQAKTFAQDLLVAAREAEGSNSICATLAIAKLRRCSPIELSRHEADAILKALGVR